MGPCKFVCNPLRYRVGIVAQPALVNANEAEAAAEVGRPGVAVSKSYQRLTMAPNCSAEPDTGMANSPGMVRGEAETVMPL